MKKSIFQAVAVFFALFITAANAYQQPEFLKPQERPGLNMEKPWPANHFLALCYHDVEDDFADERYMSVRSSALNDQMAWLKNNGYTAVSVQQILDAHHGGTPLPEKAVLLSFDDGYSSFYTRVYPLLKAYNWPALWAPVGKWLDTPEDQMVDFGGLLTERKRFADWDIVRELKDSPLVEIGSHTWDSHFGAQANPQGSKLPVAANRMYDKDTSQYEAEREFYQRMDADVSRITSKLREVTGKSPRAWVWPYGAASGTTLSIARKYGYEMAFTLRPGLADVKNLSDIPRMLISGNPSIDHFANQVTSFEEQNATRVMHVDLDYVYDEDQVQQTRNIDALIQRVFDMKISHVFLQAYADPKGDGTVESLYFPNRHLPMRADLFNFISWQLQNRADVKVYAWMPVLSFNLDQNIPRVLAQQPDGSKSLDPSQYRRLSPWSAEARRKIIDIYEDLAGSAAFHGILFHDDALLSDFEDVSQDALIAYRQQGFGDDLEVIRNSPQQMDAWSRYKSRFMTDFTLELADRVRAVRGPQIKTARNIFAMPVLEPDSSQWFGQNLEEFIDSYDWTAVMAMPLMEGVPLKESNRWLHKLVAEVNRHPQGRSKVLFELQALDWSKEGEHIPIPEKRLAEWMYQLQLSGAKHFGYYPDDFVNDYPSIKKIRPAFSSYWYPDHD